MYAETEVSEKTLKKLPIPSGYKVLIAMPDIEDTTEGGVFMPDELKNSEETASIIGFVMKVGESAYSDKSRFPDGPWCQEGAFIIFRSYSGTRFKIHGKEFRIINDDTVEAVVDDPRGYTRV